ncbi:MULTISPECIES: hypothetical protein [unclassified Streptomyces]|jgi:hypothetical protein|nr:MULTISPECIES: hypothetical protein [unclassified Streptomyces]MDH6455350.1 hypothetical protein [Streptomyces sp. SAI-119]MDH6494097.1 hypothetical protein [Streptomyces sp. SAI-149]
MGEVAPCEAWLVALTADGKHAIGEPQARTSPKHKRLLADQ